MAHITEMVKYEKRSNGQFSVHIRCCGNAATDVAHTLDAAVAADPEKRKASLEPVHKACAALHEQAMQSEAGLVAEMGKTVEHQ